MKVVALDTTTRAGSVALVVDDVVVDERRGDAARSHAERLPGEIIAIADANGVALSAVDLFAVASGPGSFTGLRIGIATMQGLALVGGRGLVGVSALEALAHLAAATLDAGAIVAPWMDAHRRDVFAALYQVAEAPAYEPSRLVELDAPSVGSPEAVLSRWCALGRRPTVFIGDGAVMYAADIAREAPDAPSIAPPALAGAIGRLAVARARHGDATPPAGIQPLYVRRPDAELDRERRR